MFFILLFAFTTFLFKNAFSVYFFSDDFFFLKISRITSFNQFLNFFSPIRQYSFKPISTEVFYFFIHLFNENIFIAHLIGFFVFFIGVYYLYRIVYFLSKNKSLAYLTTSFYAINFTHVFQLYYFGTFQEVFLFTFLCICFYKFLIGKNIHAVTFFILALLSKETAILFVPFLIIFKLIAYKKIKLKDLIPYVILGAIFYFTYQYSLKFVTSLYNYKIHLSPRLVGNNLMWYLLWSLGLPNFMPDYFTSIFRPPIPEFYSLLKNIPEIKTYLLLLLAYYIVFGLTLLTYFFKNNGQIKKNLFLILFLILSFGIFIGPIGFFQHKWMVRLAIPLIFIILIQSYFIDSFIKSGSFFKVIGYFLVILYFVINIMGIPILESSSTFLLESRFTLNAKKYFENNRQKILNYSYIYIIDPPINKSNPWGGSKKLKVTLGDQSFINLYFPNKNIKAIYSFENKIKPKNSYVVKSIDILTAH